MVKRMAELPSLTDSKMVAMLRSLSLDPEAPAPSVEAILHAVMKMQERIQMEPVTTQARPRRHEVVEKMKDK